MLDRDGTDACQGQQRQTFLKYIGRRFRQPSCLRPCYTDQKV